MTDFCKNCNHILEMTRILPTKTEAVDLQDESNQGEQKRELLNTATPEELSETENTMNNKEGELENEDIETEEDSEVDSESDRDNEAEEFYEKIITAIEGDQPLTNEELSKIDIKNMIKTDYYKGLKSKSAIKKKLLGMIEDMGNSDENVTFYLFCTNCGYSRPLDSGFHVLSKNREGVASTHDYSDDSKIRNIVHYGIYPRTREFICPNKDCASHKKDHSTEAVFMRDGNSYHMIYVCTTCLAIKRL